MTRSKHEAQSVAPPKEANLFSFKSTGRPMRLDQVEGELLLMRDGLKNPLTAKIARRICEKSGSHLLKMVSPRADGDHACLYFEDPKTNRRSPILPSTNAPDIPFCKVVWRPLEVIGHPSMSVIDHVMNPTEISGTVLDAFARVFGDDVLEALRETLLDAPKRVEKLAAGEFPIIFIPRPEGGDLQITPVSPASVFMEMKRVKEHYFQKAKQGAPRPPRGRWNRQAVSSKPQNISGAIGGPRVRFLATMPPDMTQTDAEIYRFAHGGSFPRWRERDLVVWILRYADMLEADATFNNQDTRAALDRTADWLIRDADSFIAETLRDAGAIASRHGLLEERIPAPPGAALVLLRRRWRSDSDHGRARKTLTSAHFEHRLQLRRKSREE